MEDITQDVDDFLNWEQFEKDDERWTLMCLALAKERGITLSKFKEAISEQLDEGEWTDLYHDYLTDLMTMNPDYTNDIAKWYKEQLNQIGSG